MQRRRLILSASAILVFGMALAAQRTATQSDRARVHQERPKQHWQPGLGVPMSVFESSERMPPPAQ